MEKINYFKIAMIASFILLGLSSCNGTNSQSNKQEVESSSKEDIENNKKKKIREDIANYVHLHINNGEIYITNDTEKKKEKVNIALSWTEGFPVKQFNEEHSFTYIPARKSSNTISYTIMQDNIKGQITNIKCSALELN